MLKRLLDVLLCFFGILYWICMICLLNTHPKYGVLMAIFTIVVLVGSYIVWGPGDAPKK